MPPPKNFPLPSESKFFNGVLRTRIVSLLLAAKNALEFP